MTQIPNNTSVIDTASMSSVGISSTETPPPGYMSEDGDPMDQNDNLSEFIVGDRTTLVKNTCGDGRIEWKFINIIFTFFLSQFLFLFSHFSF